MIQAAYQSQLKAQTLAFDPAQARAVDALQNLYDEILSHPAPLKGVWSLFQKQKYLKGLYLYGGVGRGKSMLMDLFYGELPATLPKRRCHFHEFMIETHNFLHQARGKKLDHVLPLYAAEVAQNCRVLCFDEFHVSDVADAMILGRLFGALFQEGVVVVTTSNRPPEELYKGGLQRDRFEPFVELLKRHMTILFLDSDTDYRQSFSESLLHTKYFTPLGDPAHHWSNRVFLTLCAGALPETSVLHVKGRDIPVAAATQKSARFSFSQLCERPLGAEDYLAIAQAYPSILLEDVPKLGYDRRNEAKRFMTLIDVLYDRKTDLYMTADAPPDKLYRGSHHSFEFERTVSRLLEMSAVQG
ncbi:MAG: cell division protein ZapE [Rhodospirillales bacterium]|nr:cell division protein ZapE [Rhodospirillales bacterium]MCB9979600.1 cell division protein ZapE [Rhodospirillales bacterium]